MYMYKRRNFCTKKFGSRILPVKANSLSRLILVLLLNRTITSTAFIWTAITSVHFSLHYKLEETLVNTRTYSNYYEYSSTGV